MLRTTLASAALVALTQAAGNAVVVNKCSYDVYMANTPSSGGGFTEVDKTFSSGDSYTQPWTELSNGNGWSIKLSKTAGAFESDILQYEYTFHNDGTIWYDLSEVNGNPWDGNWEITATTGCTPRQAAYRYATDDAYGMQSCADDASITVTLCSGDDTGSGSAAPSPSATYGVSTTSAPAPVSTTTTEHHHHHHKGHHTWGLAGDKVEAPAGDALLDTVQSSPAEAPTTLATVVPTPPAYDGPAVTVTNVHMATMTKYVTATVAPAPKKRHEHHAHHPHMRR